MYTNNDKPHSHTKVQQLGKEYKKNCSNRWFQDHMGNKIIEKPLDQAKKCNSWAKSIKRIVQIVGFKTTWATKSLKNH